jgi:hypothetical protein
LLVDETEKLLPLRGLELKLDSFSLSGGGGAWRRPRLLRFVVDEL